MDFSLLLVAAESMCIKLCKLQIAQYYVDEAGVVRSDWKSVNIPIFGYGSIPPPFPQI